MARSRNIKPAFFKNEGLADVGCEVRLLFIGLWTLADREGRLEDRPRRIRAEIFPFDGFDVEPMLNQLQSLNFISRYNVCGGSFIQITNFVKHQDPHYREKASEIPPMPGAVNEVIATGVTRTQRARILARDDYKCQQCGSLEHLCIDHITPVSKGGNSADDNLQVLCLSCNTKKGNKIDSTSTRHRPEIDPKESHDVPLIPDSLIPDSLIPEVSVADKSAQLSSISLETRKKSLITFKSFYERCLAEKTKPIPDDDPIFDYCTKAKIDYEFVELAWMKFKEKYLNDDKRYKDWRKVFRNCVYDNWYKIWYTDVEGNVVLTSQGRTLQTYFRNAA